MTTDAPICLKCGNYQNMCRCFMMGGMAFSGVPVVEVPNLERIRIACDEINNIRRDFLSDRDKAFLQLVGQAMQVVVSGAIAGGASIEKIDHGRVVTEAFGIADVVMTEFDKRKEKRDGKD